ncbi:unnamed protein product [[Candida] boidinii]|uniref:Restriction of telomere capping protein 1 n=1 Tax=Candida boidinii TaxID=5477 RepID=A0A9W6SUF5_CANBO|nr:hypothetical protein B5S30_g299 [[Candida] boidinii]GME66654.1 unnamed protein product [[Candida] boidinii]
MSGGRSIMNHSNDSAGSLPSSSPSNSYALAMPMDSNGPRRIGISNHNRRAKAMGVYDGSGGSMNSSGSSGGGLGTSPIQSATLMTSTQHLSSHNFLSASQYYPEQNMIRMETNTELVTASKSNETPNLFVLGGSKTLQLIKISTTEISVESELLTKAGTGRGSKPVSVTDAVFGYQQYGRNIAVSTLLGPILIYNTEYGSKAKTTLSDHSRAVNSLDFNMNPSNSSYIISASQDGTVKLWDLRANSTKSVITMNPNSDAVRCAQFSPKQPHHLACICDNGVLKKYDIRKPATAERQFNAHTGPGLSLDWHPQLDYVVTGGRDKQIHVWNMSNESRGPEHTISTTGPVSKTRWRRGRGNASITDTDIAASFYNDDPCIQIWNFGRKYIPKHVITAHSNQITGLIWKTPKYLVSCSKDKSIIQHDVSTLRQQIDNLPVATVGWNGSSDTDFAFVSQGKYDYEGVQTQPSIPLRQHRGASTQEGNSSSLSLKASQGTNSPQLLSQQQHSQLAHSQQPLHIPQSPLLNANQPSLSNPPRSSVSSFSNNLVTPFAIPVHINIRGSNPEEFQFLAANYFADVPQGLDIIGVCDHNATIAASVKRFRDCQVWRTIRESILCSTSDMKKFKVNLGYEPDLNDETMDLNSHKERRDSAFNTEETHSSYIYDRDPDSAHSDQLGTSPVSEFNSPRASFRSSIQRSSFGSRRMSGNLSESSNNPIDRSRLHSSNSRTDLRDRLEAENEMAILDDDDDTQESSAAETTKMDNKDQTTATNTPIDIITAKESADKNFLKATSKQQSEIGDQTTKIHQVEGDKKDNSHRRETSFSKAYSLSDYESLRELSYSPLELQKKEYSLKKPRGLTRGSSASEFHRPRKPFSYSGSAVDFDNEKSSSYSSSIPLAKSPVSLKSVSVSSSVKKGTNAGTEISKSSVSELVESSDTVSKTDTPKKSLDVAASADKVDNSVIHHRANSKYSNKSNLTYRIEQEKLKMKDEQEEEVKREQLGNFKKTEDVDEEDENIESGFNTPWKPERLIKEAVEYSAQQGDLLLCATLALLFAKHYKSIKKEQAEDWIFSYHELLLRKCLFSTAADILNIASINYDTLKTLGQTDTSIRTYCNHCMKLLVNEESKSKEDTTNFGFWYCDECHQALGGCIYCNEPVKGVVITLLECGHRGHFGCLQHWFLESKETECPAGCGYTAII